MDQYNTLKNASMGGGTGMMDSISKLFQNKLFLQMLSGSGAALAGEGSVAAGLDKVTQQSITAQNFSKMLSGILGGGGKMTVDKDKFNLTGPSSVLGDGIGGVGDATKTESTGLSGDSRPSPFRLAP